MSDWRRVTKEVTFDGLRSELNAAIKNHVDKDNLGDILSDVMMCVQTDSEKIKNEVAIAAVRDAKK
jgi:hypothetical protein